MNIAVFLGLFFSHSWLFGSLFKKSLAHWSEQLAVGYLLSCFVITLQTFLSYSWWGLSFSFLHTTIIFSCNMVLLLIAQVLIPQSSFDSQPTEQEKLPKWAWIFVGITSLLIFISLSTSFYWPVVDWDSLVLYDFRAKVFLATGGMNDGIERGYFFGYPLLTSLLHLITYQSGLTTPIPFHSLFYISFLVLAYWSFRRSTSNLAAVLGTTLLALYAPFFQHSMMGYTNLMYCVYLVSGVLFMANWFQTKNPAHLIIAFAMIAASTWTRSNEPFWLVFILIYMMMTAPFSLKKSFWGAIMGVGFIFTAKQYWDQFETTHLLYDRAFSSSLISALNKLFETIGWQLIPEILGFVWSYVIEPNGLMILITTGLMVALIKKGKAVPFVSFAIATFLTLSTLLIVVGTLVLTTQDVKWNQIGDSAQRMSMFFTPLLIISATLLAHRLLDSNNHKGKKIAINALFMIPQQVGGTEQHLRSVITALQESDTENKYYLFCNQENFDDIDLKNQNWQKVNCGFYAQNRLARIIYEQVILPWQLLYYECDTVYSSAYWGPILSFSKKVITVHDLNWRDVPESMTKLTAVITKILCELNIKTADAITVDSEFIAKSFKAAFPAHFHKVTVLPLCLDQSTSNAKVSASRNKKKYQALCVSAFYTHKNVVYLLEVFEEIAKLDPQFKLKLIGQRGLQEKIVLQKLASQKNIEYSAYLSNLELTQAYQDSSLFVFPSTYEGFGYPVYEALQHRLPVFVSKKELYDKSVALFLTELSGDPVPDAKSVLKKSLSPQNQKPALLLPQKFTDYHNFSKQLRELL